MTLLLYYNLRQGVNDFTIARDNQTIVEKMGKYRADNYRYAGRGGVSNAKTMVLLLTLVCPLLQLVRYMDRWFIRNV